MKRILLSILASIFIASTASAQISKGSVLLGGGVSFSTTKVEDQPSPEYNNVSVQPSVGKAIQENLVLGLEAGYYKVRHGEKENPSQENYGYGARVFLRKYFPIGKSFYLFGQGNGGYSFDQSKIYNSPGINDERIQDRRSIRLSFYPGVSYAVSRKIHLEAGLNDLFYINYSRIKSKTEHTSTGQTSYSNPSTEFNVGTSLYSPSSVNVGIRILLNSKR